MYTVYRLTSPALRKGTVPSGQKVVKRFLHNKFWAWTTQQRPDWKASTKEAAVLFVVFGITGSSSVALVRPALKHTIGLEGSWAEGPNSYRILSFLLVSPIYAMVLLTVGTLAGRHNYFARMATKIIGRFLPKKVGSQVKCPPAASKANTSTPSVSKPPE